MPIDKFARHSHDAFLISTCKTLAEHLVKNHTFPAAHCDAKTFDSGYYGVTMHVTHNGHPSKVFLILDQGKIGLENHQVGSLYLNIVQLNKFNPFDVKNKIQFPKTQGMNRSFGDVDPQINVVSPETIQSFANIVQSRITQKE